MSALRRYWLAAKDVWHGQFVGVDTKTGVEKVFHIGRRSAWRTLRPHPLWPLKWWWDTREWRVLVTLPCGCKILKNCKRPAVCGGCLRSQLYRRWDGT